MISNNQGTKSDTILTNLSKYLTVVSDEPYSRRKLHRNGLPTLRRADQGTQEGNRLNNRGSRPLHKTTLTFETSPADRKYLSTTKESFSGRCDLAPCEQREKCPSLHISQFSVGTNYEHDLVTTSNVNFTGHSRHPITTHEDRARWKKQMAGEDMINSTRHKGSKNIDFLTTYSSNHQYLSSVEPNETQHARKGQWKTSIYNIVNGQPEMRSTKKLNSVSGNQILYNSRKEPLNDLLG